MEPLLEAIRAAESVLVLTGAGISAESGLPTFRGAGGLWRTHRVEQLASPEGFARDPRLVWTWYNERRSAHARAQPNSGHLAIAGLERRIPGFTLATQNVDSLHVRAGSRNVLELHGNLREARCTQCRAKRPLDEGMPLDEIDHECGGYFRPDIVWFGEGLDRSLWTRAVQAAEAADVVLVVGTSGMVNPAAMLATHYPKHAHVAEINPEETVITARCNTVIRDTAARAMPELLERL